MASRSPCTNSEGERPSGRSPLCIARMCRTAHSSIRRDGPTLPFATSTVMTLALDPPRGRQALPGLSTRHDPITSSRGMCVCRSEF